MKKTKITLFLLAIMTILSLSVVVGQSYKHNYFEDFSDCSDWTLIGSTSNRALDCSSGVGYCSGSSCGDGMYARNDNFSIDSFPINITYDYINSGYYIGTYLDNILDTSVDEKLGGQYHPTGSFIRFAQNPPSITEVIYPSGVNKIMILINETGYQEMYLNGELKGGKQYIMVETPSGQDEIGENDEYNFILHLGIDFENTDGIDNLLIQWGEEETPSNLCVEPTNDLQITSNTTFCPGDYYVAEIIVYEDVELLFNNTYLYLNETYENPHRMIRIEGNNSIIDCQNKGAIIGNANYETWEGVHGIELDSISNGVIRNCEINNTIHAINGWVSQEDCIFEDLTINGGIIHGGGRRAYYNNIDFIGDTDEKRGGMFLFGYNITVDNVYSSNDWVPWVTLGHPENEGELADLIFSGTIMNSYFNSLTFGAAYVWNDPFNITGNNIDELYVSMGGNTDVNYIYNNNIGYVEDSTDYAGGDYIIWCVDDVGNTIDNYASGSHEWSGTCAPPFCHEEFITGCYVTEDVTLTESEYNITDITINTGNVVIDCQDALLKGTLDFDGSQSMSNDDWNNMEKPIAFTLNNEMYNVTIQNCAFTDYWYIVKSQNDWRTNGLYLDNIEWRETADVWDTDWEQTQLPKLINIFSENLYLTNSYIEGSGSLELDSYLYLVNDSEEWFNCDYEHVPSLFTMENTIINKTEVGEAWNWMKIQFPMFHALNYVYLNNNTWYMNPDIDVSSSAQNRAFSCQGCREVTFTNNKVTTGNGIDFGSIDNWWAGAGPGDGSCIASNILIENNIIDVSDRGASFSANYIYANNVTIRNNIIIGKVGTSGNLRLGQANTENLLVEGNTITGGNQYGVILEGNRGVMNNINIRNNNFINSGLYPLGLTPSTNVHIYNNNFNNSILYFNEIGNYTNGADICYNGTSNTYVDGSYFYFEPYQTEIIEFDSDCNELNVPNGIYISAYSTGLGNIRGNGVTFIGDNSGTGLTLNTYENRFITDLNFKNYDKGIVVKSTINNINLSNVNLTNMSNISLENNGSNIMYENSKIDKPYYNYGVGNEFINLDTPAPVFLSYSGPTTLRNVESTSLSFSVYTIAEIDNCVVNLNNENKYSTSSFAVNSKTTSFEPSVVLSDVPSSLVPWRVTCTDVFGNSVSSSTLSFSLARGGAGGGGSGSVVKATEVVPKEDFLEDNIIDVIKEGVLDARQAVLDLVHPDDKQNQEQEQNELGATGTTDQAKPKSNFISTTIENISKGFNNFIKSITDFFSNILNTIRRTN